ncbi:MAG: CheR family methyltransferase [Thermodesulfobacteriota bacterium]
MTLAIEWQPIELKENDFEKIRRLIYDQCGINLTEAKKELVKARLGRRLRRGQFKSFHDYYEYVLNDASGKELILLLDSIATNFTFFFREAKHFEYLKSVFLPEILLRKKNAERKLNFWSAGCSSGEEPYSIVMTLLEGIENPFIWNIHVLATDLSTRMLRTAEAGIYPKEKVRDLPPLMIKKYFLKGEQQWQDYVKVKDQLKQYIRFQRLNLIEPFSFAEPFDCIFCRNVMIYFDKEKQSNLVNRFYECLHRGGILIIGHAESLTGIPHHFKYLKPSIYKKEA